MVPETVGEVFYIISSFRKATMYFNDRDELLYYFNFCSVCMSSRTQDSNRVTYVPSFLFSGGTTNRLGLAWNLTIINARRHRDENHLTTFSLIATNRLSKNQKKY
jgi:hypothetical protein